MVLHPCVRFDMFIETLCPTLQSAALFPGLASMGRRPACLPDLLTFKGLRAPTEEQRLPMDGVGRRAGSGACALKSLANADEDPGRPRSIDIAEKDGVEADLHMLRPLGVEGTSSLEKYDDNWVERALVDQ